MTTPASAGARHHVPGAPLLGQMVFEQTQPPTGHGYDPAVAGGWWAFFTCRCCHEQQYDPLTDLPLDATEAELTAYALKLWSQPCVLEEFRDGYAVYPAGGVR